MNHQLISAKLIAIVLTAYLLAPLLDIFAKAFDEAVSPSSTDLWNDLSEFNNTKDLYNYLLDNDWINSDTSLQEFDYILVLTDQLCSLYDNVELSLTLAQIAVESRFDSNTTSSGGACGLMQLLPIYHEARMRRFVEDDHIFSLGDFYDKRLNVATGIDYMSELIDLTGNDISYALMCYNQGPSSAKTSYKVNGRVSTYAKQVTALQQEIERYLTEGRV